jgi:hypothetical protein
MRKVLVIFLLGIYLVSTTEAYQLLKLPAFVFHYIQHSKQDPHMGLADFLRMHYAEEQALNGDWQQDMQLPFKAHEDAFSLLPHAYFPPGVLVCLTRPELCVVANHGPTANRFFPGMYSADIFQPPRL